MVGSPKVHPFLKRAHYWTLCPSGYQTEHRDAQEEGDPGRGGLQGTRPRAGQLGGPASRGLQCYTTGVRSPNRVTRLRTVQLDSQSVVGADEALFGVSARPDYYPYPTLV
eukprot:8180967-Pyramimonas_sp.AAC.1